MKGIGIKEYGNEKVLTRVELPTGEIGADEVLIEIKASGVNPVDWKIREGKLKDVFPYKLPLILGWDAAGRIKATGSNVVKFKPGDDVFFRPEIEKQGTYADEIVVPARLVAFMPDNLNYLEAASIPLVGLTVWQALVEEGKITKGMKVLILAGSGGIGSFAIQLAKHFGAYVATTTSSKNVAFVKDLGADEILTYDNNKMSTTTAFDLMFDTLGGEAYAYALGLMKQNAVVASIISERDAKPSPDKAKLEKEKNIELHDVFTRPDGDNLRALCALIEQGQIRPIVSQVFPMTVEGAVNAQLASQGGRTVGKIILFNQ